MIRHIDSLRAKGNLRDGVPLRNGGRLRILSGHANGVETGLLEDVPDNRILRLAYQSRPDPEIAAHLGEVLWSAGQTDEARKVWREGRARDSANDVLRETLARLRVDL